MTPAACVAAAIDVLASIEAQRRPASEVLSEWGRAHRFAGSKDRAAIAGLLFDALRRRSSGAWIMGDESPRGIVLGSLHLARGLGAAGIAALCTGEGHGPAALTDSERARLETATLDHAPTHVAGDFPEWLAPSLEAVFGDQTVSEMRALAARAPVDLRVNLIKGDREKSLASLSHLGVKPTKISPLGLRIEIGGDGRGPALSAEKAFIKGLVETQDEGSQIAALLANAKPGDQVLDLCAGGGGKTLALAAQMQNRGQIYASDDDGRRLAPIFARLDRADARNVQVRMPRGATDPLADIAGRCDIVLIDAPCTGTGTWRRSPDSKWRMRPGALEQRIKEQDEVLARAEPFVKAGGRIVYVTCSVLREENEDRVAAFLAAHPDFKAEDAVKTAKAAGLPDLAARASALGPGLRLSPLTTGTDGFYVCALVRRE